MNSHNYLSFVLLLSLAACGGGGSANAPVAGSAPVTAAAPATPVASADAGCPVSVSKLSISDSFIPNATITTRNGINALTVKTPASGALNFSACIVQPTDAGYVAPPLGVTQLLPAGKTILLNLRVAGDVQSLTQRTLTVGISYPNGSAINLAMKVTAYTQNSEGIWVRNALATTVSGSGNVLSWVADVTSGGYYSVE